MTDPIRIPRKFFDDHDARDLPTPAVVHATRAHVWVVPAGPKWEELLDDARFYASDQGWDSETRRTICRAAAALLRVVEMEEDR